MQQFRLKTQPLNDVSSYCSKNELITCLNFAHFANKKYYCRYEMTINYSKNILQLIRKSFCFLLFVRTFCCYILFYYTIYFCEYCSNYLIFLYHQPSENVNTPHILWNFTWRWIFLLYSFSIKKVCAWKR